MIHMWQKKVTVNSKHGLLDATMRHQFYIGHKKFTWLSTENGEIAWLIAEHGEIAHDIAENGEIHSVPKNMPPFFRPIPTTWGHFFWDTLKYDWLKNM